MITLTKEQENNLKILQQKGASQGHYEEAYRYLRDIAQSQGDKAVATWLERAASINSDDGSFASEFVRGSTEEAGRQNGKPISDADFQRASNKLAESVFADVLRGHAIPDAKTIIDTDVKNAVESLGLKPYQWAGTLGDWLPPPLGLGNDYINLPPAEWRDIGAGYLNALTGHLGQDYDGFARYIESLASAALSDLEPIASEFTEDYYETIDFLANFLENVSDWYNDTVDGFEGAIAAALRRLMDPIIVDLDGDGVELTAKAGSGVVFDMDGDGVKEWTGWIGKDDAFLVIDANKNGQIDDINELIGDPFRSGFKELVTYDANGDNVLNAKDPAWAQMQLWRDANSDGLTNPGELLSLAQGGLAAIDLRYTTVHFTAEGNQIHESSVFEKIGGGSGALVDAWLDVDNIARQVGDTATGNADLDALPNIRGYGDVPSLRQAMQADGALASLVVALVNLKPEQLGGTRDMVENIIYRWAGTGAVASDSRGANFDGRDLATLEKFLGTPYAVGNSPTSANPSAAAVPNLNSAWTNLVDGIQSRLLLAGPLKAFLPATVYDLGADRYITLASQDNVIAGLKAGQPVGDNLARAHYWSAALPAIDRLAEDAGIALTSTAHRDRINAALSDIGLGKFQTALRAGIGAADIPASGILAKAGAFYLGEGADTVAFNSASMAVFGLGGDDQLTGSAASALMLDGGEGNDLLAGSEQADWLDGGAGADRLSGLGGDDTYVVDNANDQVLESRNEGNDTVRSSVSYALGNNVENLALTGDGALNGTGNALANSLTGNAGANLLDGGDGNDSLNGGGGADILAGGNGDDTYTVDNAGDNLRESYNGGTDTVIAGISYALGRYLENLALTGTADINATGNALRNTLAGNSGANRLDGGPGADQLAGQGGDDTYVVDVSGDSVTEEANGGTDTLISAVGQRLGTNLENLVLTGDRDIDGTGNALVNALTGNSGANTLDGGEGADTLAGGLGDDAYIVDSAGDLVKEAADAGIDTVKSAVSFTLGANLENLVLTGTAASNGAGNALDNLLTGNAANNTLAGGDGADSLDGKGGADLLQGGGGNDSYFIDNVDDQAIEADSAGTDTVWSALAWTLGDNLENLILTGSAHINATGNARPNQLVGNVGNNLLNGGAGADQLAGQGGDDTYVVGTGDTVLEYRSEGTDTVQTGLSYALGDNLENLVLTGTANVNGVGNALNNTLTGNAGANALTGGDGNDSLDGGGGADILAGGNGDDAYSVDSADDIVQESFNGGSDTIKSSASYALGRYVENLTLLGTAAIDAIGNSLRNTLTGNEAANKLDGGADADRLSGGGGDDTYIVDNDGDTVAEAATAGADTVRASVNFTLGANLENLVLTGTDDLNATGNALANQLTGNAGANKLDGGADADAMAGGAGDDTYSIDHPGDSVKESANAGTDTVKSAISYTLGANLEILVLTGTATLNGAGNALDNALFGNAASNLLEGGGGNDTLDGGAGADTLKGGSGNDTYAVDHPDDKPVEAAGGGSDTVRSMLSWILKDNLETLELAGTGNIDGSGNGLDNQLTGNAGSNVLDGQGGTDAMAGQGGSDTYILDNPGDAVIEYRNEGNDTVKSSVSHALEDNVENLVLLGSANLDGTGNALDNFLSGTSGVNVLDGGAGNDRLDGAAGDDLLKGGTGADTFIFSSKGGIDTLADFTSGSDFMQFSKAALPVGDGDGSLESAAAIAGPGSFNANAELVIVRTDIAGGLSEATASAAIGSANTAYAVGAHALFAVDDGKSSAVYYFTEANGNAAVEANELALLGRLDTTPATSLADYGLTA